MKDNKTNIYGALIVQSYIKYHKSFSSFSPKIRSGNQVFTSPPPIHPLIRPSIYPSNHQSVSTSVNSSFIHLSLCVHSIGFWRDYNQSSLIIICNCKQPITGYVVYFAHGALNSSIDTSHNPGQMWDLLTRKTLLLFFVT